jgi:hypothetical protein
MTDNTAAPSSLLMELPLEVRHAIFEYAAARDVKPKKLLRYWFEKQETKELAAQVVAANPTGPAPQIVYQTEPDEDSDVPEVEEEQEEQDDDDDNEDEDEDAEDGEENDDDEDAEADQEQDEAEDALDAAIQAEEAEDEDEDAMEDQEPVAQDVVQPSTSVEAQPLTNLDPVAAQTQTDDEVAGKPAAHADADMEIDEPVDAEVDAAEAQSGETATEDTQDDVDEDGDAAMTNDGEEHDDDEDEATNDGNADSTATAAQPPPPAPPAVIQAHRKWRHIPNFMRITQCPPPAELLLTSKQLNAEAKNWFYDVAILRISATNSFAHTSFFEEAFSQITDAAFSPMENIRKVDVMFVWDTTWLRADETGFAQAIFPALLRQRADFVHKILSQAPDLREVTVHWHDSAQDDESMGFMLDILAPFHELNANVKIEEHYIAADAKPHKRSIAGKQRVQFQQIVDAGLDRLF